MTVLSLFPSYLIMVYSVTSPLKKFTSIYFQIAPINVEDLLHILKKMWYQLKKCGLLPRFMWSNINTVFINSNRNFMFFFRIFFFFFASMKRWKMYANSVDKENESMVFVVFQIYVSLCACCTTGCNKTLGRRYKEVKGNIN